MAAELTLPPLDMASTLEFNDARGFKDWLKLVPLINIRVAHADVLGMLERLNRAFVPPLERLKMLELLRDPLALLQEESAKRYVLKAFPLLPQEAVIWEANVQLWEEMSLGYQRCLDVVLKGEATVADYAALIAQRALRYQALAQREYHLCYQEVTRASWEKLYELYQIAEAAGLQSKTIKDSLNTQTELSSCNAVFVQALLMGLAGPQAMPFKQILWLDRLLDRWANQVPVRRDRGDPEQDKSVLICHLDIPDGSARGDDDWVGEQTRYFMMDAVAKSLKKRIKYLRAGESPQALGLGEEYSAQAVEHLLVYFYQQWCEGGKERGFTRRPVEGRAELGFGLSTMYALVRGEPFQSPEEQHEIGSRLAQDFQLFGSQATHLAAAAPKPEGMEMPTAEPWVVLDESAMGFRLQRERHGNRLMHNQLLLIRAEPAETHFLGTLRWLNQGADGLVIGVRILPGVPSAVMVRATGLSPSGTNKYIPVLALPAVAALKAEASLVLPPTWFKPGRILEIRHGEQNRRLKLLELLERGPDFERVSYAGG